MTPSSLSGLVTSFFRVLGSTVVGKHSAVLVGLEGGIGGLGDFSAEEVGEQMTDVEAYGAPGIVFRPRPKETIDGEPLHAEAFGVRTPRGGVPLAWRDLRWHRRFPAPKPGSVAFVGYGGAFLAFDDADGDTSLATLYVPYARNGAGVPTKAHSITIDPTQESIKILHGDGAEITLLQNKGIMAVSDNSTWWEMKPGTFNVQAAQIGLVGSVFIGNPTGGAPLSLSAELAAHATWAATHAHSGVTTGPGASGPPAVPPPVPVGTTRVKAV